MAIPTIDLGGRDVRALRDERGLARAADEALATVGTFVLTGHGVPRSALEGVRTTSTAFFAEPPESKRASARPRTPAVARGYFGLPAGVVSEMGMERFSFGPWDVDRADPYFGSDEGRAHFPDNRFPPAHAAFEAAARAYFAHVQEASRRIAALFEVALGAEPGTFVDSLRGGTGTATAIRYPGGEAPPEGGVRIQAHNDVDLYTILRIFEDERTDLWFLDRNDQWHEVPAVPDGFVVNVGDLMQRYTDDRWLATSHKVVVPPNPGREEDRFSLAYFEHPRYDATVAPLPGLAHAEGSAYEPVRVADFERQRRMLIHLGGSDPVAELSEPIDKRLGTSEGAATDHA